MMINFISLEDAETCLTTLDSFLLFPPVPLGDRTHGFFYLHAINPPWQPAALLRVPMHMSTSLSQLNSSATPPPFFPQTNVP